MGWNQSSTPPTNVGFARPLSARKGDRTIVKPRTGRRPRGAKPSGPSKSGAWTSPRTRTSAGPQRNAALAAELRGLRLDLEKTAGQVKEAIQKIERLTLAVGDLQEEVAELHASLGDGEVEYGAVEGGDSEMGEGHA